MIMGVSVGRLRGGPVPPHDARLLQGAALHGRRLGHRRDGAASSRWTAWAASAGRCRSPSAASSSAASRSSGVPPFSGFFSKDEILLLVGDARRLALGALRGRLHRRVHDRDLHVPDDLPGLLRRARAGGARARGGPPRTTPTCRATRRPARSRTPTSASPAPSTTSPSARSPMKIAMGLLACWRDRRRRSADPQGRPTCVDNFLEPTFADSQLYDALAPSDGLLVFGLVLGAVLGAARHRDRLPHLGAAARRPPARIRERFAPLHRLFVNKWYFDELIDAVVVRPVAAVRALRASRPSSACSSTASSSAARPGSCAPARPRCAPLQTGFLRYYAALLSLGVAGVALYFLIAELVTIRPDRIPLDPHLAAARRRAARRARCRARRRAARRARRRARDARARDRLLARLRPRRGRPAARHRRAVDLRARHPLQARPRRAEPVPRRADGAAVRRRDAVRPTCREWERPRLFYFQLGARRDRRARRVLRPGPAAVRRSSST